MKPYPHRYQVTATGGPEGGVDVKAEKLEPIETAPPEEFGGPGDRWSPETMLVAAVGDCLILTFRAVARASELPWKQLDVHTDATLDRVDRATQFTEFRVRAELTLPAGVEASRARTLLQKAERGCLITNSLKARVVLDTFIKSE